MSLATTLTEAANLTKLKAFVAFHIGNAATKADPDAYLMGWADFLGVKLDDAGSDKPGMAGLTAFDIANARDELAGAAAKAQRVAA